MKHIYSTSLAIALLLTNIALFLVSCDKDTEVVASFDFKLEQTHPETTIVNNTAKTVFSITPKRVVTTNRYSFKYEILSGKAVYLDGNGNTIAPNTYIELSSLHPELYFKASEIGEVKVKVWVRDQIKTENTVELLYKSTHNDFTLKANATTLAVKKNEVKPITISIANVGEDKEMTYERSFSIVGGVGELLDSQNTDQKIKLNQWEEIKEGTYAFNLTFSEIGNSKLVSSIRDKNGQVKTESLDFTVENTTYSFTAEPEKNSAFIGRDIKINFLVTEDKGGAEKYTLRYKINSGEINMKKINGDPVFPNTPMPISTENTFHWLISSYIEQEASITFFVKNDSGIETSRDITIHFKKSDFEFTAQPEKTTVFAEECTDINFRIIPSGSSEDTFTMLFTNDLAGDFTMNRITYKTNTPIVVTKGEFTGCFTAKEGGKLNLVFHVSSSSDLKKSKNMLLDVTLFSHTFSAPRTLEIISGSPAVFSVGYQSSNTDIENSVFYTIDDGNAFLKYKIDDAKLTSPFSLNIGKTDIYLEYTEIKDYTIQWTYTNNLGVSESYTTEIKMSHFPYQISLEGEQDITFGMDIPVRLKVNTTPSAINYKIKNWVSSDPTVKLTDGEGNNVGPGYNLLKGINYLMAKEYTNPYFTITFDVVDSYNQGKTVSKEFTTAPIDFKVQTIAINSQLFPCDQSGGAYAQFRKRNMKIINNSSTTVEAFELYDINQSERFKEINVPLESGKQIPFEITCTAVCSGGQTYYGCELPLEYSYRVKIGDSWSEYKTVIFPW